MWSDAAVVRKIPDGSDEFFAFPDRGRFLCPGHNDKNRKGVPIHRTGGNVIRQAVSAYKKFGKKAKRFASSSRASFTMSLVKYFVRSVDMPKVNVLDKAYSGLGYVTAHFIVVFKSLFGVAEIYLRPR